MKLKLIAKLSESLISSKKKNKTNSTENPKDLEILEKENQAISFEEKLKLSKPIVQDITLEEIKRQQNYKPIDKADFEAKIKALDIKEPIEDLLGMLTP